MEITRSSKHFVLLVALIMTAGCAEHELTTSPTPRASTAQPSHMMAALPSFFGSLPAAGGSTLTLPSYAAFPEGILVVMTVSGTIHVTSDSHANYFHDDVNAGPGGVWTDGVYQQCSIGVVLNFGGTNYRPPLCTPYDASASWTRTEIVQGNGSAKRNPNIPTYSPGACDTIVCHTYAGSQTVIVEPVAGDLDLQARYALEARTVRKALFIHPFTNSEPYAYQRVTFSDSTTPRGLPMKSLSHTWTMMDPAAPGGTWGHTYVPCPSSAICPVDVRESGVWTSQVRVNGVEHTDDITVYCSDSDPLLNNDLLRQQLLAVLDSSNAGDGDYTQRSERFFLVLQDMVTPGATPYLRIYPHRPDDDVCFVHTTFSYADSLPANTTILAHGHSHPSEPNTSVMCKDDTGARTLNGRTVYGADQGDRDYADLVNTLYPSMPEYIIDKHNLYILRPGQSVDAAHNTGNQFNWDGRSPTDPTVPKRRCGWPKRIVP